MGFDAQVSYRFANEGTRGLVTYVRTTISEYFRYRPQPYELFVDDEHIHEDAFVIAVCNAAQYGNNAYIAPRATMQDGELDVTVIHRFNLLSAAVLGALAFMRNGVEFPADVERGGLHVFHDFHERRNGKTEHAEIPQEVNQCSHACSPIQVCLHLDCPRRNRCPRVRQVNACPASVKSEPKTHLGVPAPRLPPDGPARVRAVTREDPRVRSQECIGECRKKQCSGVFWSALRPLPAQTKRPLGAGRRGACFHRESGASRPGLSGCRRGWDPARAPRGTCRGAPSAPARGCRS